jgi:hypothetical protein
MAKVVIVGEIYYSELAPDQGLPAGRPPVIWGGPPRYPDQGLPPIPGMPDNGLPPVPGVPVHLPSPLPTPPGELANDLVIAVYKPGHGWTVTSYDLTPVPTPHR